MVAFQTVANCLFKIYIQVPCDRRATHLKPIIKRYINGKHDVTKAEENSQPVLKPPFGGPKTSEYFKNMHIHRPKNFPRSCEEDTEQRQVTQQQPALSSLAR